MLDHLYLIVISYILLELVQRVMKENKFLISKSYMAMKFLNEYNQYLNKKITKFNLNFL